MRGSMRRQQTSMTEEVRTVRVVDPIHGYINLTPIERRLLDAPVAQRLRYVGQSGLAHLAFPDLRTSRFIHSLGAMHLSSRFLAAAIGRSERADRLAAQRGIKDAVETAAGGFHNVKAAAKEMRDFGLLAGDAASQDYEPFVMLAEQGLRLAALFHDLGHLPFSHDFEYALEQLGAEGGVPASSVLLKQREGRDALHERIGHDLAYIVLNEDFTAGASEAPRITFEIAMRILETSEAPTASKLGETGGLQTPAEGAFAWLHTLIAGELDVDRCDYVLRDARSYAFESARFDLQRLIDNFIVVRDRQAEAENALVPAVRPEGQAAVEAFLVARARIYQWGTRHHKVGQVAAALRYASGELLREAFGSDQHDLHEFVTDLNAILAHRNGRQGSPKKLLKRFGGYDDQWWMGKLRAAEAKRKKSDREWFELVCWRSDGPQTLWKRTLEFPLEKSQSRTDWNERLEEWNSRLPTRPEDTERFNAFDAAVRELREKGILVIRHRFEPWRPSAATRYEARPKSALSFYDRDQRRLIPVTDVSQPVEALRTGWMRDLQVQAFALSTVKLTDELCRNVLDRLVPT
jgi:HD superfamily phosphohydrolase